MTKADCIVQLVFYDLVVRLQRSELMILSKVSHEYIPAFVHSCARICDFSFV